jgi:transposase
MHQERLSDIVYQQMLNDALTTTRTGPGGQQGNDSDSSATGPTSQRQLFGQATSRTRHQPA